MTNEMQTAAQRKPRIRLWTGLGLAAVIVLGLAIGLMSGAFGGEEKPRTDDGENNAVRRGRFVVSVSQPGALEPSNKKVLRSGIKWNVNVEWMIEEGTIVEAGDTVCIFDSTELKERLLEEEQVLDNAKSSLVAAKVALENTESQTQSDIARAELALEFAHIAVKKYIEGEYPQELKSALASVEIAGESRQRAEDKSIQSEVLQEKGYITLSEAKADAAAARKAQLDVEIAEGRLEVLQQYTYVQQKRRLESDVEQAAAELERVKNKAAADIENTKVKHGTAQATLVRAQRQYDERKAAIEACTLRTPVAGRVVYAPQGRRHRAEEPLGVGSTVNANTDVFHIPESGSMSVQIKIDESQRDKVAIGMLVLISGSNLPERGLRGKLNRIAEYLDPTGWWNNNQKLYSATVVVDEDEDLSELRTGMSCKADIVVAAYDDVLTVPLQAVTIVDKQHVVYLPGPNGPEPVPVEIGLDNGRRVHVISGLEEGQEVVMRPPLQRSVKETEDDLGNLTEEADKAAKEATANQQQLNGNGAAKEEAAPDANAERTKQMMMFLTPERIDAMSLDEATKATLKQAAADAQAGKDVTLDEATMAKMRAAFGGGRRRGGAPGRRPGNAGGGNE